MEVAFAKMDTMTMEAIVCVVFVIIVGSLYFLCLMILVNNAMAVLILIAFLAMQESIEYFISQTLLLDSVFVKMATMTMEQIFNAIIVIFPGNYIFALNYLSVTLVLAKKIPNAYLVMQQCLDNYLAHNVHALLIILMTTLTHAFLAIILGKN